MKSLKTTTLSNFINLLHFCWYVSVDMKVPNRFWYISIKSWYISITWNCKLSCWERFVDFILFNSEDISYSTQFNTIPQNLIFSYSSWYIKMISLPQNVLFFVRYFIGLILFAIVCLMASIKYHSDIFKGSSFFTLFAITNF